MYVGGLKPTRGSKFEPDGTHGRHEKLKAWGKKKRKNLFKFSVMVLV